VAFAFSMDGKAMRAADEAAERQQQVDKVGRCRSKPVESRVESSGAPLVTKLCDTAFKFCF